MTYSLNDLAMLICNNCHHINEDHSTRCTHCQMCGNFTYQKEGERKSDEPSKKQEEACLNCGSLSPGEGDRCTHCNFPRPIHLTVEREEVKKAIDFGPEIKHR